MTDLPVTNPEDRKKLKAMIVEMTNVLSRVESEREHMSEISDAVKEEFGIQKKVTNKLKITTLICNLKTSTSNSFTSLL